MALSLLPKQTKPTSKESSVNKPQTSGSPDTQLAQEIRSGFFVVVSFAALLALLFLSGQSQFIQGGKKYTLQFNYVGGLTKNSPVHLSGYKVGKVSNITLTGNPEAAIAVEITVDNKAVIRQDTAAYVDAMGFMGEKFVELTNGTPEASVLAENAVLRGTDPMPMMELVKKGTELLEQFERSANAMDALLVDVKKIVGENTDELDSTFKNIDAMSLNLKDMTHDLKRHPWKLLRKSKENKDDKKEEKKEEDKKED